MNSDQLRHLINQHYNPPPAAVPREEMWNRIRAARDFNAPVTVAPRETIWARVSRQRGLALPAQFRPRPRPGAPRIAARDIPPFVRPGFLLASLSAAAAVALFVMVETRTVAVGGSGSSNSSFTQGGFELSSSNHLALGNENMSSFAGELPAWISISDFDPVSEAYRRAATTHLRRSDAFISGFRSLSNDAVVNTNMRETVRELLSNTRLLLNSHAAVQAQYRGVFQDLEMVLVRMTLLTPSSVAAERSLIEKTLEKRKLIPRMRELMPAPSSSNAN